MSYHIDQISDLPNLKKLVKVAQGLALLDAILVPEWEDRFFSFNCNWDGCGKEMMASMRDGSGQEFFLLFTNDGAIGKVKGNNSLERNEDVLKIIPKEFEQFKNEPAFCNEDASFFFWRRFEDHAWTAAPELPEYQFLGFLANGINAYKELMENYYEKFIDLGLINDIFEKLDVSESELKLINPSLEVEKIQEDIREIKGGK